MSLSGGSVVGVAIALGTGCGARIDLPSSSSSSSSSSFFQPELIFFQLEQRVLGGLVVFDLIELVVLVEQ
jgi:hypothetical protein